jgi:hypothetical protein
VEPTVVIGMGVAAVLAMGALAGCLAALPLGRSAPESHRGSGLGSLPLSAQAPIGSALGADDSRYWIRSAGRQLVANSTGQRLVETFTRGGARVSAGQVRLSLGVASIRSGGRTVILRNPRSLTARRNRVSYHYGAVEQWFANGPLGLEHGFTIARSLSGGGRQRLVLGLRLGGNVHPEISADGLAATFDLSGRRTSLRYGSLLATDARGRRLPATIGVDGGKLQISVLTAGARYPVRVDPLLQLSELTGSDTALHDAFGGAVAISGQTLVVGAPLTTGPDGASEGAVYVFTEDPTTGWSRVTQTAKLSAGGAGAEFGLSVAYDGGTQTMVVGAPGSNLGGASGQGAVFLYVEPPSGWYDGQPPTASMYAGDGAAHDGLGSAVAISGYEVAAGAPNRKAGTLTGAGSAYLFADPNYPITPWPSGAVGDLVTPNMPASGGQFGASVAVSGNDIAIGAMGSRSVYAFAIPGPGGIASQTARLTASNGDSLGQSVAICQDDIIAGAPRSVGNLGAVYDFHGVQTGSGASATYSWSDSTATSMAQASGSVGTGGTDRLGITVACANGVVAAGAQWEQVGSNGSQGAAYEFNLSGTGALSQQGPALVAADGQQNDWFGAVALDPTPQLIGHGALAVGAPEHPGGVYTGTGAAYVFADGGTLTVTKAGTGSGIVTSNDGQISCGSACTGHFQGGTARLTATAAPGSTFAGWSGTGQHDGCQGAASPCTTYWGEGSNTVIATFNVATSGTTTSTSTSTPTPPTSTASTSTPTASTSSDSTPNSRTTQQPSGCANIPSPATRTATKKFASSGLSLTGTAAAPCPFTITSVSIAIARRSHGGKCRFLQPNHTFGAPTRCKSPVFLAANGTTTWSFDDRSKLAPGTYWLWERAVDSNGVATANTVAKHVSFKIGRSGRAKHLGR